MFRIYGIRPNGVASSIQYIGMTSDTIPNRLVQLQNSNAKIRQYPNPVWVQLGEVRTEAEARQLERQFITLYDTFNNGDNETPGG